MSRTYHVVVDEGAGQGIQVISRVGRVFRNGIAAIRLEGALVVYIVLCMVLCEGFKKISFLILGGKLWPVFVAANKR